jgi:hypothetical protein
MPDPLKGILECLQCIDAVAVLENARPPPLMRKGHSQSCEPRGSLGVPSVMVTARGRAPRVELSLANYRTQHRSHLCGPT